MAIDRLGQAVRDPIHAARYIKRRVAAYSGLGKLDPFVVVGARSDGKSPDRLVVCRAQNDVDRFIHDIARLPQFAESRLLRGLERALRLEIYEAADLFFSWSKEAGGSARGGAYIGIPGRRMARLFKRRTIVGEAAGDAATRARLLVDLFNAYARSSGNDAMRFALVEALGFALSRALGHHGQYAAAEALVDRALSIRPASIHLKSAKHALYLKLDGKAVPERLAKFIGDDNGYLTRFICPLPFERFDIGPTGDVLVCCGHWLPTSIGNFLTDPVDQVLNSARALKIRESVTDGSYKYCNHLECGAMIQGTLPTHDQSNSHHARTALLKADYHVDSVHEVTFALDQTCNLSYPSCRRDRILERASDSTAKTRAVEEKLVPLLSGLKVLNINPAGELFASKPSRKLLEMIDDDRCPDLVVNIISNGTLFQRDRVEQVPGGSQARSVNTHIHRCGAQGNL